jgi:hypothetical protein
MADPRRLREILGFGYGAPSPAMSAMEPFHAGVDPAYMPQDVVTESPTEGPRGWVRSGLESLFGAIAPSDRAASNMAEKVTNLSDFVNVPQEAFDVGQEIGNTLQGGDPRMLAMSLIPGKADELVPAVKAAQKQIKAYHGTPHDFEKFDLSKIGTGEGAQAYGHGLYFAENEGVARNYRDQLAKIPDNDPVANAYDLVNKYGGDPDKLIQMMQDSPSEMAQGTVEALKSGAYKTYKPPGHLYEVNINADPDAFLDWDKPLSEQSETVKRAAGSIGMEDVPRTPWTVKETSPGKFTVYNVWGERHGTFADKAKAEELAKRRTIEHHGHGNEFHPISQSAAFGRGKPEVANKLREQGVAGIKYLDAGSRAGGDGSRNYVVFSDEIIDIVKKYGIAGALGAGLITQQMADQLEAQQGGGQS